MFNVGGGEVLVIAVIALIVLGPQRLPTAARQIGKTLGDLRRLSSGFQEEVRSALEEPAATPRAARPTPAERADDPVTSAVRAVGEQAEPAAQPRRARRAPLRAAPVEEASGPRAAGTRTRRGNARR